MLFCVSSWAQNNIVREASPKLQKFLSDNPVAAKVFKNAISNAFSNRTVRLFYFYSDDDSEAPAFHFYPNTAGSPDVMLCICENQPPLDEFITTLFETLNSRNENAFENLFQDAYLGTKSREQFATEISRFEFEATKDTRSILLTLKFRKKEINESYYYRKFIECPTNFDGFLSYSRRVSPHRDAITEYELKYDSLRKMYHETNSVSNSPTKN
jgi:hypothetical protein